MAIVSSRGCGRKAFFRYRVYKDRSAKRLQQLKGTPIGYVLFKRRRTLPNQRFISHTEQGWQRQTRYDWYGRKLLISETFLLDFLSHLDER